MTTKKTGILSRIHTRISGCTLAMIATFLMIVFSGCSGGRGGIKHHYNSPYGDGVVYYESYDVHGDHHDNGWHGHNPKKNKNKAKKHKKHHHDD